MLKIVPTEREVLIEEERNAGQGGKLKKENDGVGRGDTKTEKDSRLMTRAFQNGTAANADQPVRDRESPAFTDFSLLPFRENPRT
ncbi:hypothetical protein L218DRAFT_1006282 [Marasmius fiardii PR-910]|nr:hypothetical protein L218DRAFT_1006282 [Marasmius fiardii PR-910]